MCAARGLQPGRCRGRGGDVAAGVVAASSVGRLVCVRVRVRVRVRVCVCVCVRVRRRCWGWRWCGVLLRACVHTRGGARGLAIPHDDRTYVAHPSHSLSSRPFPPLPLSLRLTHAWFPSHPPPTVLKQDRGYAVSVLYDVVTLLDNGRPSVLLALEDARRLLLAAAAGGGGGGAAAAAAADGSHPAADPGPGNSSSGRSGPAAGSGGGGRGGGPLSSGPGGPRWPIGQLAASELGGLNKHERRRLAAAERKLYFFQVWANEQPHEAYQAVTQAVAAEWQLMHAPVVAGGHPPLGVAGAGAGAGGRGGGGAAGIGGVGLGTVAGASGEASGGGGPNWRPGDVRVQ